MIFSVLINILCFILIFILAAAVLIIFTLLFAPFYFKIKGGFHDRRQGFLSFKWLFIRFNAEYNNDKLKTDLSYPFKKLIENQKNKKAETPKEPAAETSRQTGDSHEKPSPVSESKIKIKKKADKSPKKPKHNKKTETKEKSNPEEKSQSSFSLYKERFDRIMSYENKSDIINCFVNNIKYIINKLKFKTFEINVRFGFGDPSLTGKVLGLLYATSIALIKGINTEPDFSKAVFEAAADIEGRGNLLNIIIPAVKFILNKNVRKILFQGGKK
ncbi:MAG: DUF2953 domain-containing protein [Clostridiales bacterium]|nr:DUF2953 domain-containing protein [Clostridiales bacterium]